MIPVILIFENYIQVALYVWRKSRQVGFARIAGGVDNSARFKSRIRIVKLLVVVAAIFALSWFPFFVMLLYAVRN